MTIDRNGSMLFKPLKIADGRITLKHRVILAPLTRNRGLPLIPESTASDPNRIWYPDELVARYYEQRATEGGLIITEGIPPSLESNGMPGVPGLFHPSQVSGWKKVTNAVYRKGGFIYAQLWHAGRATIPHITGTPAVSASASSWDNPEETYSRIPQGHTSKIKYADYPPIELSVEHIKQTINDYCSAAKHAMEAGFDGVEIHGGNGYLPEQFLSSNINRRTDEYGGTPQKRCKFVLELMDSLASTVGEENMAIRLSPFGLFNQARGEQRLETWEHLCKRLKAMHPKISYVSFIEPRFEQIFSSAEKENFLKSVGLGDVDLSSFREAFGDTPFFTAGGFNDETCWGVIESGQCDALIFGRYFLSNPDLVERLALGRRLSPYNRATFYGPRPVREEGYTDYPSWQDLETTRKEDDRAGMEARKSEAAGKDSA